MFGREPALWLGLIAAAIAIGVGFGVELTDEQVALIMAGVVALLSFATRSQVTPITTTTTKGPRVS